MQTKYQRLQLGEREEISRGLSANLSFRAIASSLGRSVSTISREIKKRGMQRWDYRALRGEWQFKHMRRRQGRKRLLTKNERLSSYVIEHLLLGWSPEQIAKRMQMEYPTDTTMRISHETIYRYLYVVPRGALKEKLLACLRQGRKHRRPRMRAGIVETRGKIPQMVGIDDRPKEVENRVIPGHWEGDLIAGAWKRSAIGTLTERTTRFTIIVPLSKTDPETVHQSFAKEMNHLPDQLKKTLTYDQGQEMKRHYLFTKKTKIQVYFAHKSSPWERGTNENTNGLIRQYFPKRTDFDTVSRQSIKRVQNLLNDRPRKCLGYKKPNEVLGELLR